jgi:hypothetical protein
MKKLMTPEMEALYRQTDPNYSLGPEMLVGKKLLRQLIEDAYEVPQCEKSA